MAWYPCSAFFWIQALPRSRRADSSSKVSEWKTDTENSPSPQTNSFSSLPPVRYSALASSHSRAVLVNSSKDGGVTESVCASTTPP